MGLNFEKFIETIKKENDYINMDLDIKTSSLAELGVDSISMIDTVLALEEEFNIEVPITSIDSNMTMIELYNKILDFNFQKGNIEKSILYESYDIKNMHELFDLFHSKYRYRMAFESFNKNNDKICKTYEDFVYDIVYFIEKNSLNKYIDKNIGIVGSNSYEWILTFFSIIASGNVPIIIMPNSRTNDIYSLITDANISLVFIDEGVNNVLKKDEENYKNYKEKMNFMFLDTCKLSKKDNEIKLNMLSNTRIVLYSSGTTGKQKGVILNERNLLSNAISFSKMVNYPKTTFLALPLAHSFGLMVGLITPLLNGCKIFINSSFNQILDEIKIAKPEFMAAVPVHMKLFDYTIDSKLKSGVEKNQINKEVFGGQLKILITGGAFYKNLDIDKYLDFRISVLNGYGITECSPVVSVNRVYENTKGSVGKILPCNEIKITNKDSEGHGIINVKGENVMQGYFNTQEERKSMTWFNTEDYGYCKDDFLYLSGRAKNMILLENGENVFPIELENILDKLENVIESKVYVEEGVLLAEIYCNINSNENEKNIETEIYRINQELPVFKRIKKTRFRQEPFRRNSKGELLND